MTLWKADCHNKIAQLFVQHHNVYSEIEVGFAGFISIVPTSSLGKGGTKFDKPSLSLIREGLTFTTYHHISRTQQSVLHNNWLHQRKLQTGLSN